MWAKTAALLLVLLLSVPALAQTATPTDVTVPSGELDSQMATAAASQNNLPTDITRPQSGPALVPATSAVPLFSYVKWLFSYSTAQELMGETLAPLGVELFILLTISILLSGVYLVVNLIVLLIRFVVWIYSIIIKIIGLIPFI